MSASNSFTSYRKSSEELLTSDEDSVVEDSFCNSEIGSRYHKQQSNSKFVEVSESSESDVPVGRPKNRRNVRVLSESDDSEDETSGATASRTESEIKLRLSTTNDSSDEEEQRFERRALSPRTRRSITGYRPAESSDSEDKSSVPFTDDEDELHSLNAEETPKRKSDVSEEQPKNRRHLRDLLESQNSEDKTSSATASKTESENKSRLSATNDRSDEEEESFERRALSPRTRMSITGYRPPPESSDSEDESSAPFTDDEDELLHSFNPEGTAKLSSLSDREASSTQVNGTKDKTDGKIYSPVRIPGQRSKSYIMPRPSENFNTSISTKFSSTIISSKRESTNRNSIVALENSIPESNDPISVLPLQGDTIEIMDSSSDASPRPNTTQRKTTGKSLIQPKIISLIEPKREQNFTSSGITYVSQETYDNEMKKLSELKAELSTCENLMNSLGSKLPDKGKRMSGRGERLKMEIEKQATYISKLKVEESLNEKKRSLQRTSDNKLSPKPNVIPSWEELTQAANAIQPTHTGKVGMANFVAQKTITVERLKDIHASLETCPNDNVLADDPKYLLIPLMNHQKHALAWMNWREKQMPRGGILADDMGLGKTLTMISLVLDCTYSESADNEEESSDSENSDNGWYRKGKKNNYYGGTLVVCPASLIIQWENEVGTRVKRGKLSVCVYHGTNRESRPKSLAKYDMVITTYNIISRENATQGTLYLMKWDRIILDEAHMIRNHKTKSSEAACKLMGKKRWALTGTPIQNKEMDLYALLKFLKCSPFDDLAHWKRWIDNKSAGGLQRLNTLTKSLMLRRTKQELQNYGKLSLPDKSIELVEIDLDKDEMAVYQKVMLYSRTIFSQFLIQRAEKQGDNMYIMNGGQTNNKKHEAFMNVHQKWAKLDRKQEVHSFQILVLLLRLRQICCHPGLIDSMLEEDSDHSTHSLNSSDNQQQEVDLLEELNKLRISDDNPSSELSDSLDTSKKEALSKVLSKALLKSNPVFQLSRLSSKMKKVIEILEAKILNTSDKALIVSQWTSVLDILSGHLTRKGLHVVSLNGSVPVKLRMDIVNEFNNPNSRKKIMLLSLTAGGVGLNLVGANHLFLLDLHWNPQLEAQAQDRIYRVGQNKKVYVYKLVCKETIEERIKGLQDLKLGLANAVMTGVRATEGAKLSIDDLKSLFGI